MNPFTSMNAAQHILAPYQSKVAEISTARSSEKNVGCFFNAGGKMAEFKAEAPGEHMHKQECREAKGSQTLGLSFCTFNTNQFHEGCQ